MADDFREAHKTETFKSMITISIEVFKALILINGGAAAGMVAMLDKLAALLPHPVIRSSMTAFVLGLCAAVLATFFSYFTQNKLHLENIGRQSGLPHWMLQLGAILFCCASLGCFVYGAVRAAQGLPN